MVRELKALFRRLRGLSGPWTWLMSIVVLAFATRERRRLVKGDKGLKQPPSLRVEVGGAHALNVAEHQK